MRVLVVGHSYPIRANQMKLDALARCGVDLTLLAPAVWTPHDGLFAGRSFAVERPFDSFEIRTAPVIRSGHVASYLFRPDAIAGAIRAFRPDIVHVEQEVYSFVAAEVMLIAKPMRRTVTVAPAESLDRAINPLQRPCRRLVLARADGMLPISATGAALLRRWGYNGRMDVIPWLGVDTKTFSPDLRRPTPCFTVGFVGRMVEEKGVDVLIAALGRLRDGGIPFRAVFLGAGPLESELRRMAAERGLDGRIDWKGTVPHDEVPAVMGGLDVLALPSRTVPHWSEQFGLVLIQAMAMGIPVVGSSCGAIPEVIGCEEAVFPEGDDHALADLLIRLARDPAWRERRSAEGLERVRKLYTNEAIAARHVAFWRAILDGAQAI